MVNFSQEVRQSGNSLVIKIPNNVVKQLGILEGDWANFSIELIKPRRDD